MQDTNDETLNDDATTDAPEDTQVRWNCFSCGKHLGEQGDGGSFTLDFVYGSGLDMTRGINGWICDECICQKHGRLRVSNGAQGMEYWLERNQIPLAEHEETKTHVSELDFFGRRRFPGRRYEVTGWRDYDVVTAEERSRVEASLFGDEPVDKDLVVKVLQALMESEAARHEADSQRWRAESNLYSRARQQAERLSAEELAQLRVREAKGKLAPGDVTRLWEHAEWNETHFREQQEKLSEQAERIKELEAENKALKERLTRRRG
jgi:hypothetical protein